MNLQLKIGTQIRKERELRDLVQQQVGKAIGVTRGSVCNYESGLNTPTLEGFIALADFFGISLDALAGRETEPRETTGKCEMEAGILSRLLNEALEGKMKYKQAAERYKRLLSRLRREYKEPDNNEAIG